MQGAEPTMTIAEVKIYNIGSTVQGAQLPRLSVSLEDLFAKAR
jgi:hypothetical protein